MKKIILTALALLLMLVLIACNAQADTPDDTTPAETTPADTTVTQLKGLSIFKDGKTSFKVIWPNKPSDPEFNAYAKLNDAFKACGVTVKGDRDSADEAEYEILIGETAREQSKAAFTPLRDSDYVIKLDGTKLIIAGGSDDATFAAAMYFIENYMSGDISELWLSEDFEYIYTKPANVAGLTLNSVDIAKYTIVYHNGDRIGKYAATLLQSAIAQRTDYTLPLVTDRVDQVPCELRVGNTSRSGDEVSDKCYSLSPDGDSLNLKGDIYSIVTCVNSFIDMLPTQSQQIVDLKISQTDTEKVESPVYPAEATLDGRRLVALCDQQNNAVVMIDLDAPDITAPEAVVWKWTPTSALGFKQTGTFANRIDEAILRYSAPLGKYVMCTTSSSGFIGVAEYPSGKCIFETNAKGYGPHAIEYLPDGSLVAICSGNSATEKGCIRLYPAKEGKISESFKSYKLVSGHGVVWDEYTQVLWALGSNELRAYRHVGDELVLVPELSDVKGFSGGHNLSISASDPDVLWISGSKVWQFRKSTGKLSLTYDGADQISASSVKSVDSFDDGTVIRAIATGVYASHNTDTLLLTTFDSAGKATTKAYVFTGRAFYKARRVDPQYS